MAETIDDNAKEGIEQDKKPDNKVKSALISGLEEIVEGTRTTANLGIAVAAPTIADTLTGGFDASSTAVAFYLGSSDRSSKSARQHSIIGTAFALFSKYTLTPIYSLGAYASAAFVPFWQLAANTFYMATDNIVKKKSLYIENFRKRWKDMSKKALLYLSIPTYLTQFLPGLLQIPSIALQSYIFKKYIAKDSESTAPKDKTPLYVAARNITKKVVYGTSQAAYAIGSTFYEKIKWFFSSAAKKASEAVQPQGTPATAGAH